MYLPKKSLFILIKFDKTAKMVLSKRRRKKKAKQKKNYYIQKRFFIFCCSYGRIRPRGKVRAPHHHGQTKGFTTAIAINLILIHSIYSRNKNKNKNTKYKAYHSTAEPLPHSKDLQMPSNSSSPSPADLREAGSIGPPLATSKS